MVKLFTNTALKHTFKNINHRFGSINTVEKVIITLPIANQTSPTDIIIGFKSGKLCMDTPIIVVVRSI